ncbi:MAG: hypothetical protein IPP93_10690 [Chitinophagaceae bacterium]|nr:hypothetical protein [Chitinophagaceae bacterium]
MKKLMLSWLVLLLVYQSLAQTPQINQINIPSFTVKNILPGNIDNWLTTPGALLMTAQKVPGSRVLEPRMVIQIRSNGALICGNSPANPRPVDPFDVRTFNTADLVGMLGNCHELKEGSYTICVQFYNIDKIAISREVCKDFTVEAPVTDYSPPVLISPGNEKTFSVDELQRPVTFRWTPLVPKPKEPVTYRLKVWQLMQGQNSTTAMRSNQPIVTKDVDNINQVVVNGVITGPCRPPYLCEFIWSVQALSRNGKPLGNNNGLSEPYTFKATENNQPGDCQPPALMSPANSKSFSLAEAQRSITFRWTPLVPKPRDPVTYRLKVWQLMQGQNGTQAMRSNQPIVTKDVDNISEVTVSGIYTGPCRPPYLCEFIWQVQAIYRDGNPAGCKEGFSEPFSFKVESGGTNGDCQPPALSAPANNKNFTTAEAQQSITFRWTPLVPKPRDPVTYRLKVWQLMQGQNGTQAMRSNQPIVTKDVDNISEATVSGIYTGPCRPPYLCEFIWQVQAIYRDGNPACCKEGFSEPFSFKVESGGTNGDCQPPVLSAPAKNKNFTTAEAQQSITFRWTPLVPKPRDPVTYRLKVWQLMQGQNGTQAMRSNQPIVTKDVDNLTEVAVSGIYTGPCKPPYLCEFIWQVQAINRDGTPAGCKEGTSEPFSFKIESSGTNGDCQPPVLTAPANNKSYKSSETSQPVTFRWTPVVPKPRDPVTYRLKVWQLMQGQNGTEAMRSNKPIVTKDVADVSEVAVSGIYTGPCKPPYLCEFIWQVQALNREGKPVGCKEGMSEPFSFKMQNNIDIEIDSLKVGCCEKGKQSIYISVKNNLANPVKITAITYKINGAGAAIPLTPLTPVLPVNITGNGSQVFTSSVDCMDNATWLKFLVDAEDIADPDNKETEVASDTLHCICNACDSMKIDINQKDSIKLVGNNLILNNTISVSPKPVKSVNAELVYFEYVPESEDCMLCNKDPKTFGNFISAETGIVSPTVPAPHTVNWNIGSVGAQVITNQAINFTISMPPTVKCCAAQVRWCIRYVITFADCTVCNKLVCYTYNKKCDCK